MRGPPWLACVVVACLVVPSVAAHGPPIAAGVHDDLALVDRDWTVATVEPEVFDLDGPAYEEGAPAVAFRVHADAMLVEGVVSIPQAGRPAPEPAFNIGVRLVDVRIDPPVALAGGDTLSRILLGPMVWDNVTVDRSLAATVLSTNVTVPWPDADGVSPSEDANETRRTDVRMAATFTVVGAADADDLDDPDALHGRSFLSPAELRIDIALHLPEGAAGHTAMLSTRYDFFDPAEAQVVAVDGWEGVRLHREARYAALFAEGVEHTYVAFRGEPMDETARVHIAPIAMNVTSIAGSTGAPAWRLGLGFAMPRSAWTSAATPSPDGPDNKDTPFPSLATFLVTLLFVLPRRRGVWPRALKAT